MVAAKSRKDAEILFSRKFPLGSEVEVKNRADGVIVVVRGKPEEKTVRT